MTYPIKQQSAINLYEQQAVDITSDLLFYIAQYLDPISLVSLSQVNRAASLILADYIQQAIIANFRTLQINDKTSFIVLNDGTVWWRIHLFFGMADPKEFFKFKSDTFSDIRIKDVALGDMHELFLTATGKVFTQGYSSNGQMGLPSTDFNFENSYHTPVKIQGLDNYKVNLIATSEYNSLFITECGKLFACGGGKYGVTGLPTDNVTLVPEEVTTFADEPIIFAALGVKHAIFISQQGKKYACGQNKHGQLGLGTVTDIERVPREIMALRNYDIRSVALGYDYSIFVTRQGKVLVCGDKDFEQLGVECGLDNLPLTVVSELDQWNIIKSVTELGFSLFLTDTGKVLATRKLIDSDLIQDNMMLEVKDNLFVKPKSLASLDGYKVANMAVSDKNLLFITYNGLIYTCDITYDLSLSIFTLGLPAVIDMACPKMVIFRNRLATIDFISKNIHSDCSQGPVEPANNNNETDMAMGQLSLLSLFETGTASFFRTLQLNINALAIHSQEQQQWKVDLGDLCSELSQEYAKPETQQKFRQQILQVAQAMQQTISCVQTLFNEAVPTPASKIAFQLAFKRFKESIASLQAATQFKALAIQVLTGAATIAAVMVGVSIGTILGGPLGAGVGGLLGLGLGASVFMAYSQYTLFKPKPSWATKAADTIDSSMQLKLLKQPAAR